ncbi:ZIP zinc/iron transport family [Pleurostoma richardsiae]|uniref:ZIP zinc/iron transport family n=1 Tax=Pleurostoma richardsiae TaxID=41990 RepID=A0AA38RG43_9PEZI|nr:ZIP zinc/iron transport family [Pleurostoma richardsiae]
MSDAGVFDPTSVNLDDADQAQVVCYLNAGGNDYNGHLGARVSSIFVIFFVSTVCTFFPVVATHAKRLRIPLYVYLFARYFGTGVIIATAFIHLLDPAYGEIGPASCVGLTGNWAQYTWPPAIALTSIMIIFLLDFLADFYVENKYGVGHEGENPDVADLITTGAGTDGAIDTTGVRPTQVDAPRNPGISDYSAGRRGVGESKEEIIKLADLDSLYSTPAEADRAFKEQIAAFLILEFGVIFHSVIIGLNLGVVGDEFKTLYPVLVFHQSFEGLGIGARLSVIPFPRRLRWMPWALCLAYGLTTPISIAIGLGVRTTYNSGSFTANVVSGVLDSISAGILIYTGLVEMLARDFIFNPKRTRDKKRLAFMLVSLYLGTGIMALLGKWA